MVESAYRLLRVEEDRVVVSQAGAEEKSESAPLQFRCLVEVDQAKEPALRLQVGE